MKERKLNKIKKSRFNIIRYLSVNLYVFVCVCVYALVSHYGNYTLIARSLYRYKYYNIKIIGKIIH